MAYYVRAFCLSNDVPSTSELENYLLRHYPYIRFESENSKKAKLENAEIFYKKDNQPIIVECNYNDSQESLAAEECAEFIEEIGSPIFSISKRKVIKHLNNTKYIISCQLLNDIDDDGYNVNGTLLNYFVENHNGLIHADGEGFYEGFKVIVKTN